jgi:AraC family transcriptional regulator
LVDSLDRLNAAIGCIEDNLRGDVDMDRVARLALNTPDGFTRLFSFLTGVTLSEYIRRRRLTLAAFDLQDSGGRIIDIAARYGYESADAFSRAFAKQHGLTPSEARRRGAPLKVYPPISFHMVIKGDAALNVRIIETEGTVLKGLSRRFTGCAADRFEQEHIMWADHHDDIQSKVSTEIPGTWYGLWDSGTYWIARAGSDVASDGLADVRIPGGTYAVFTTKAGGFAGDEFPQLHEQVFGSWLTSSGYIQTADREIEVYHLFPRGERDKRYYELWIPVRSSASGGWMANTHSEPSETYLRSARRRSQTK